MEKERSGTEEVIGPVTKKRSLLSLPATTSAAMMDMKDENNVVEEVDGIVVELSSDVKESHKVLNFAIKSVCLVYDVTF